MNASQRRKAARAYERHRVGVRTPATVAARDAAIMRVGTWCRNARTFHPHLLADLARASEATP